MTFPHAAIYQVLADECGADPDGFDDFRTHWPACHEYRFMGALGFGGKVWADRYHSGIRVTVNCYMEDETPERLAMIERANARLRAFGEGLSR